MSISFVQSVWTVIAMVVFIGIVIWAYSGRRKTDFDKASRMAMEDERTDTMNSKKVEE